MKRRGKRRWMPMRRLRTQLLAAFGVVAAVALVAGGVAVVWLLLDYRAQATSQRLRDAAVSAGVAGSLLQRQGATADSVALNVASQVPLAGTRVLVLDAGGRVAADATAEGPTPATAGVIGRRLEIPAPAATPVTGPAGSALFRGIGDWSPIDDVSIWRGGPDGIGLSGYLLVAPGALPIGGPPGAARGVGSPLRVVLAVPLSSLTSAGEELAPGLAGAAGVALLAAGLAAWWLAGSIARPIRAVTQETERVARGEPHQPVPEEGATEVAQLARGFNAMVREVARSQKTLRDFVADASHELRTPLTAIRGFSQAVADGVLEAPDPTRDAVRHIHREAERMNRLVEDLLLLSKVEARDLTVVPAPVDVAELLDTLAQRLHFAARQRDLRLELDLPDSLTASGDATQLEHLFGNLLDNAAKYSPDGGTVTVRAVRAPGESGQAVVVTVHNTGSVIPAEDLPHVFERFYRVDKSRAREVAGSGLGLAIAKEIAERHDGTIRVTSDAASGTSFVVTLPAAPEGNGPPQVSPAEGQARAAGTRRRWPRTTLSRAPRAP